MDSYRDSYSDDGGVTEEVEALKAILMNELEVIYNDQGRPVEVVTTLHPATAEDTEQQFVRVTLVVILPPEYPDCSPEVQIRNPRGLADDMLDKIRRDCHAKCEDYQGCPVIYELIETVKEVLTCSNTPTGQCPICLCDFMDGDAVSKTECYHHFHCYCLGTYVQKCLEEHKQKQAELPPWQQQLDAKILCPVCREIILVDLQSLLAAPLPQEDSSTSEFSPTDELKELRQKMADLYVKQKEKGGIIDIKEEENRFLLLTGESEEPRNGDIEPQYTPGDPSNEAPADSSLPEAPLPSTEFRTELPCAFTSYNAAHKPMVPHQGCLNSSQNGSRGQDVPVIPDSESLETGVGNSNGSGRSRGGRSYGGRPKYGRFREWSNRRRPPPPLDDLHQKVGGSSSNESSSAGTGNGTLPHSFPGPPPVRPRNPGPPHRARRPPPGFSRKPPLSRPPPGFEAS